MALTFDDAYRSVFELGFPILSRLAFPGTVFVARAFPGGEAPMSWPGIDGRLGRPHECELVPTSWEELSQLPRDRLGDRFPHAFLPDADPAWRRSAGP
jgi:peptidoglycan/xylan/chitin deacetylase (PgdA/CDA1 family)